MTIQEASSLLGLTQIEVQELIRYGILPAKKAGHEYQIDHEDALTYKKSAEQYETRMGHMVRTSVALGAYDLRFPTGR
jgi:excisionase family DNA binding protein